MFSFIRRIWKAITGSSHTEAAPSPAADKPQVSPRTTPVQTIRRANIGIDYGTSTTKIYIRDRGGPRLLRHKQVLADIPAYCLPSSVRASDGMLFFGSSAEADHGLIMRSLKVCVACQQGLYRCPGCEARLSRQGLDPGFYLLRDDIGGEHRFSAEELCTLYTAAVLPKESELDKEIKGAGPLKVTVNGAAPLDFVEHNQLESAFLRIFYHGQLLSGFVGDGISIRIARDLLDNSQRAHPAVPPESDRLAFLVQETIAGLHGPCSEAGVTGGLYAVVDIGAGTTNVTFFRLGASPGADRKFSYYSSRTELIGGNDIDRAILGCLPPDLIPAADSSEYAEVLQGIRIGKHSFGRSDLKVNARLRLPYQRVLSAIAGVSERIYAVYRKAFGSAYEKEPYQDRWIDLKVFLIGGGSLIPGIEDLFQRKPHSIVEKVQVLRPEIPDAASRGVRNWLTMRPSDYVLTNLAYGLSTDRPNIHDYFRSSEVEPLVLTLRQAPPQRDVEEMYPK